jgi:hypothetical protein
MSRISPKKKATSIRIKQGKAAKLARYRRDYIKAGSKQEKDKLWSKIQKLSPFFLRAEFEATLTHKE